MKRFFVVLSFTASSIACAQTLHDPVPIQGNAVTNAAASAAMYSAMTPNGGRRTPEQNARRIADLEENKTCRTRALQYPAGHAMRRSIRDECRQKFDLARASWK
jgi:hypothetical protein